MRMFFRRGHDWTDRVPRIANTFAGLIAGATDDHLATVYALPASARAPASLDMSVAVTMTYRKNMILIAI